MTATDAVPESDVTAIVQALAAKIRAKYVIKGADADHIAAAVEAKLETGAYVNLTGDELASALTNDLRTVNGDKHLSVTYSPLQTAVEEKPTQKQFYNDDGHEVDKDGNLIPDEPPSDDAGYLMFVEHVKNQGTGLVGLEVLPGNIGYINLSMFAPKNLSTPVFQMAMTHLQHTRGLIIDVRNNTGGDDSGELISYFLTDRVHYKTIYWRVQDINQKWFTNPNVPGPRYNTNKPEDEPTRRPVYVLTGPETFSSAEAFTFFMKDLQLAQTVGGTTAGGGNPCGFFRIGHDHFTASISIGRSYSPKTGKGWEKVGVAADISCPAKEAKEMAHLLLLKHVQEDLKAIEKLSRAQNILLRHEVAAKKAFVKKVTTQTEVSTSADGGKTTRTTTKTEYKPVAE
ncbi:ClpP/crotonase-like domain-containing protein [Chytriomyces sp. MP71]|nr:ClpP/crotonase-like domain-containing protein [Chytriomyces sp. MP71]